MILNDTNLYYLEYEVGLIGKIITLMIMMIVIIIMIISDNQIFSPHLKGIHNQSLNTAHFDVLVYKACHNYSVTEYFIDSSLTLIGQLLLEYTSIPIPDYDAQKSFIFELTRRCETD